MASSVDALIAYCVGFTCLFSVSVSLRFFLIDGVNCNFSIRNSRNQVFLAFEDLVTVLQLLWTRVVDGELRDF